MKRLVTLFFVLAVCGTGAVAQEGAYKTVKDIAYRDAAGDGNIDTIIRSEKPAFRPWCGTTAAG